MTADLTPEWSCGSMLHPLSHIYVKTPFCCVETVATNALNRRRVVVFDQLWVNAPPTLNTAFSLTNVHAKWWTTPPSDIFNSSAISRNFNLRSAKMSLWSFFSVFRNSCHIWMTRAFRIISVCTIAFKVSMPLHNRFCRRSRVRITLIKSLLSLNCIFPIRKQCFINTQSFRWLVWFGGFYDISTFVGYLTPNPFLCK